MKFVVQREQLSRALARLQGVVSRKASKTIITNVLIEARAEGVLRLAGTDLDVTIDSVVAARVTETGRIAVDGKRLFEVIRSIPGEEVDVSIEESDRMLIRSRNSEFMLLAVSADSYPNLPALGESSLMPINGIVLRELIERTMFSVSTDDSRPSLSGVFFQCIGGGRVRVVSTDGHRLSQGERDASRGEPIPEHDGVIIPRKGVGEIKRLLDEVGHEVSFGFVGTSLALAAPDLLLFVRLIDAAFPDYKQVVPKSSERKVIVDRQDFLSSLKRIGLLANEKTKGIRIELRPSLMVLSTENPEAGRARDELEIEGYAGGELTIAFNADYVRDILATLSAERIEMSLNEALSPGLFREADNEDYLFVVMPMRI